MYCYASIFFKYLITQRIIKATKGDPTSHGRFDGCRATAHPSAWAAGPQAIELIGQSTYGPPLANLAGPLGVPAQTRLTNT